VYIYIYIYIYKLYSYFIQKLYILPNHLKKKGNLCDFDRNITRITAIYIAGTIIVLWYYCKLSKRKVSIFRNHF